MTSGKRESDRSAARNVVYSFRGSFGSASPNARAFGRPRRSGGCQQGCCEPDHGGSGLRRYGGPDDATEALAPDPVHHLVDASGGERMPAGHHFVQDDAQGPDIVGFVGEAAGEHLGRKIAQGAACGRGVVRLTGQAEIQQFWRPVRREPNVAWLDISMQESFVVQRRQCVGPTRL